MIASCWFLHLEAKFIIEHHLCCLQLGVHTIAKNIFQKQIDFMIEEAIGRYSVVRKIQVVAPNCAQVKFVIHREALKRHNKTTNVNEKDYLQLLLDDIVKMVNYISAHEKKTNVQ